jgi:hypothetical protein
MEPLVLLASKVLQGLKVNRVPQAHLVLWVRWGLKVHKVSKAPRVYKVLKENEGRLVLREKLALQVPLALRDPRAFKANKVLRVLEVLRELLVNEALKA